MKITALQEYGMRCILQLALGDTDRPQKTTDIAKREGLSRDYVEKILFQLQKANIVRSVRGIHGGYVLTKAPEALTVGQVILALSERPVRWQQVKSDLCRQYPGKRTKCVHMNGCSIRLLWSTILSQIYSVLNQMPLSFLIGSEEEVLHRIMGLSQKKISENIVKDEVAV